MVIWTETLGEGLLCQALVLGHISRVMPSSLIGMDLSGHRRKDVVNVPKHGGLLALLKDLDQVRDLDPG